jgi:hypothetical protein
VSAADRGGRGLGQTDVTDLARRDECGQGADGVLDRRVRIDSVLVVQIDMVGGQPLQGAFDRDADVRRAAVENAWAALECETMPNFVANTTFSRRSLMARPTSSSLV